MYSLSLTWALHVTASISHLFSLIGANANFRSQSVFLLSDTIFYRAIFILLNEEMKFKEFSEPANIYRVITGVSRLEFPAMKQQIARTLSN